MESIKKRGNIYQEEKRRGIHLAVTVVTYLLVLFSFLFFFEGFGT